MYIHKYIYISKCIKQHKIISTTARRGMGAEVEIYIRGKGNHAHSSLVRKQRSSRGWFSIQRETRIPTWFLSQREGRPVLPMSLLFCGALLGSTATCGTRPMRGERDDVTTEHSGIHKTNDGKWAKKRRHRRDKEPPFGRFLTDFREWNSIYLHFSIAQHVKTKRLLILKTF